MVLKSTTFNKLINDTCEAIPEHMTYWQCLMIDKNQQAHKHISSSVGQPTSIIRAEIVQVYKQERIFIPI